MMWWLVHIRIMHGTRIDNTWKSFCWGDNVATQVDQGCKARTSFFIYAHLLIPQQKDLDNANKEGEHTLEVGENEKVWKWKQDGNGKQEQEFAAKSCIGKNDSKPSVNLHE